MAGVLETVDMRTQLVGENRLEILMFRLQRGQLFAINVFKVQEVQMMPKITPMPNSHPAVIGVTHARGKTIPVIDLSLAIGMPGLDDRSTCTVIITEYNNHVQAFMVKSVDRIINMNWAEIMPPPRGAGRTHYLTAITKVDDKLVEIIDVEKVLQEISPFNTQIAPNVLDEDIRVLSEGLEVLVVDDSSVAIAQVRETLDQLGMRVFPLRDGAQALRYLKKLADDGEDMNKRFPMIITDAEMPEMDGYRLTTEIRNDPRLSGMYVILHTSLSGTFNKAMVKKVGCDDFLSKFEPDMLAATVQARIRAYRERYPVSR